MIGWLLFITLLLVVVWYLSNMGTPMGGGDNGIPFLLVAFAVIVMWAIVIAVKMGVIKILWGGP